tara:strand:- start:395 stop:688 length:294 start_codon:yes stop_codon:yes gene_type:complete
MDTNWIELRVDYEKVAAFSYGDSGQTYDEAKGKAFALLEVTRLDLYRDKVMQVIEMGDDTQEKIIHEEHPTVWNFEWGPEPSTKAVKPPTPYDLTVL